MTNEEIAEKVMGLELRNGLVKNYDRSDEVVWGDVPDYFNDMNYAMDVVKRVCEVLDETCQAYFEKKNPEFYKHISGEHSLRFHSRINSPHEEPEYEAEFEVDDADLLCSVHRGISSESLSESICLAAMAALDWCAKRREELG